MVDDQRANQIAKPLKEGKKKSPVQEQWNFSLSSSAVTLLASTTVCVSCAYLEPSYGRWQVGGVPQACWWRPLIEAN
jgi:hypothetical protein